MCAAVRSEVDSEVAVVFLFLAMRDVSELEDEDTESNQDDDENDDENDDDKDNNDNDEEGPRRSKRQRRGPAPWLADGYVLG